jgi:hypothetical protein
VSRNYRVRAAAAVVSLTLPLWFGACAKSTPQQTAAAVLDDALVARVGAQAIVPQTVERIAAARGIAPRAALDLAVEDALLAERARSALPPYAPQSHLERLALTRSLMQTLVEESRSKGPPTEAELKDVIDAYWWELDRPELSRTIHAVVIVDDQTTPEQKERAPTLAEKIREVVQGATPADFQTRAEAVERAGLTVKVESLSPVARDGRMVDLDHPPRRGDRTGMLDAQFAAAAAALGSVGQVSTVVHTQFGYHVIMLTERFPAKRAPQEQLDAEAMDRRAKKASSDLLAELRKSSEIVISEQASVLAGLIQVAQ